MSILDELEMKKSGRTFLVAEERWRDKFRDLCYSMIYASRTLLQYRLAFPIVFIFVIAITYGVFKSTSYLVLNHEANEQQYGLVTSFVEQYPELTPVVKQAMEDRVLTEYEYYQISESYHGIKDSDERLKKENDKLNKKAELNKALKN